MDYFQYSCFEDVFFAIIFAFSFGYLFLCSFEYIVNFFKNQTRKKIPKIIVLSGAIGVGKTTLGRILEKHMKNYGMNVCFFEEATKDIAEELEIFYLNRSKYSLFFQFVMFSEQEKLMKKVRESMYDYVILDRAYLDQLIFSEMNMKGRELEYITSKIRKVDLKIDNVIYVRPDIDIMVKRNNEDPFRDVIDEEYLRKLYDEYEKKINEIYPNNILFENDEDVSSYDIIKLIKLIK
jgi:deoxyadenosine/deoxycytidine kinase